MKRMGLLILVLVLLVDLAQDGYLGRVVFCPSHHSAKTSITPSDHHPGPCQSFLQHGLTSLDVPGRSPSDARSATSCFTPKPQKKLCCHLSGAGGIPLKSPFSTTCASTVRCSMIVSMMNQGALTADTTNLV
jgi:hypothetical protein